MGEVLQFKSCIEERPAKVTSINKGCNNQVVLREGKSNSQLFNEFVLLGVNSTSDTWMVCGDSNMLLQVAEKGLNELYQKWEDLEEWEQEALFCRMERLQEKLYNHLNPQRQWGE